MNVYPVFSAIEPVGLAFSVALIKDIPAIVRHLRLDQCDFATMMRPQ